MNEVQVTWKLEYHHDPKEDIKQFMILIDEHCECFRLDGIECQWRKYNEKERKEMKVKLSGKTNALAS